MIFLKLTSYTFDQINMDLIGLTHCIYGFFLLRLKKVLVVSVNNSYMLSRVRFHCINPM